MAEVDRQQPPGELRGVLQALLGGEDPGGDHHRVEAAERRLGRRQRRGERLRLLQVTAGGAHGALRRPSLDLEVTLSVPQELLEFADRQAQERHASRSSVISDLLRQEYQRERDALAREGYEFYAAEAQEFADSSGSAVWEALRDERPPR